MSQIEARILQQEYLLTCPDGQEASLLAAVDRIDADMERIRNTGKVRSRERVGVLVAVNLAFENATLSERVQALEQELAARSTAMPDTASAQALPSSEDMQEAQQSLREQELQQAQQLIARIETALNSENRLL